MNLKSKFQFIIGHLIQSPSTNFQGSRPKCFNGASHLGIVAPGVNCETHGLQTRSLSPNLDPIADSISNFCGAMCSYPHISCYVYCSPSSLRASLSWYYIKHSNKYTNLGKPVDTLPRFWITDRAKRPFHSPPINTWLVGPLWTLDIEDDLDDLPWGQLSPTKYQMELNLDILLGDRHIAIDRKTPENHNQCWWNILWRWERDLFRICIVYGNS